MKSLINSEVLPFNSTAYHNGKFVAVSDADLRGKWSVVFFYPADFTFVCPTELGDLADNYAEFKKLGVEIYSVSTDTHFTHKAWHDSSETIRKIDYVMVGDPTGAITRNFGVMIEEEGLALRGTFIINPEGVIKVCEIHDLGIGRDIILVNCLVQQIFHVRICVNCLIGCSARNCHNGNALCFFQSGNI